PDGGDPVRREELAHPFQDQTGLPLGGGETEDARARPTDHLRRNQRGHARAFPDCLEVHTTVWRREVAERISSTCHASGRYPATVMACAGSSITAARACPGRERTVRLIPCLA